MYCNDMKALFLIPLLVILGCKSQSTPTVEPIPSEQPVKTHPAPQHKPKRMICDTKPAVVAVIDTGFNYPLVSMGINLCKFGHRNFTSDVETKTVGATVDPIPTDSHGHGTNVAGLIQQYAGNKNYCMVILRYYSPHAINDNNLKNTVRAIEYATRIGAKYINYSGGGGESSPEERAAVKKFLDKGGRFIAAAGNEKSNIDMVPYYPAMDDTRVIKVGSVEKDGSVAKYSNFGKSVTRYEQGTNARALGLVMSGTSQATAIATGKIINQSECEK